MSNAIKSRLDAMSLVLLDRAGDEGVKVDDQIDIYKAVVQYYLGTTRSMKGKLAGDDVDVPSFKTILAKVQAGKPGEMQ